MKFLKVWKGDISNIRHNKIIAISVIAIVFVPLIYGGLYLAAFWDPYGKTENLAVAVVNEDKGAVMDDKDVNYGKDIVERLKNNKDIKWQFIKTRKEAEQGLKSEKGYYAMMIIPKDFSQKIADVDKGSLEKPKMILVANEKKNYVIGLITDKAGKAVKQEVDNSIMDNFTIQVYDSLYKLRDGMETAANGTSQIKDGVTDLKDSVPTLSNGVNKLYDGSVTLNDKLKDASDGSNKLRDNLGTLNSKMPDLVDGVSKLHKASSSMEKKIGDASDGSKKLRDGVLALNDQLPDLSDGVNDLYDGSTSLKESLGELQSKMPDLIDGVGDLKDGAKELNNGIKSAASGANDLRNAVQNSSDNSQTLSGGVDQLENGAASMQSQLRDKITPVLQANLSSLIPVAQQIAVGTSHLNSIVPSNAPIKSNANEAEEIANKLLSTFNNLSDGISNNDTTKIDNNLLVLGEMLNGDAPNFGESELSKAEDDLNVIGQAIPQAQPTASALKNGIAALDSGLSQAKDPLKLFQGTGALKYGAEQIKTQGVNALYDNLNALYEGLSKLSDGSDKLYSGLDTLYDKSKDLSDGVDKLYDGSQNLNDGVDKFKGTVPVLTNGVSNLSDGTRDLSDGLFKLKEGAKTLDEKMGELDQKVPDLQDGVQQLYDGSTDLSDGLIKLVSGSGELKDGLKSLKDKIPDMQDGINTLYESIAQLNDSFIDGAKELSDKLVPSSKAMGKYMSDPIKLKDDPLYEVSKYGEGMAPYFISLALWVGALMLPFIIADEVDENLEVGPRSIMAGKYLTYAIVGALQAVVISFVVMKIGLKPSNIPVYYMFNVFLSLVFFAIIENLIFFFGNPGRLSVIIILLLQLTSSNGTFPGELLPKFFRTIGPFLPFTYSISALREIDSGIDWSVLYKDVTILMGMMVAFMILSMILSEPIYKIKKKMEMKMKNSVKKGTADSLS